MAKKKLTRIMLTLAMLMGISLVWAATEPSDGYTEAKGHVDQVQAAYDKAQNTVASVRLAKLQSGKTWAEIDVQNVVFNGLNKYLNKRAEVLKAVKDELATREAQYQKYLGEKKAWDELTDEQRAGKTEPEAVAEPDLADILAELDLSIDGFRYNSLPAFRSIANDLQHRFTTANVEAFYEAWYAVYVADNNTQPYNHTADNAGVNKLDKALADTKAAIDKVKNEDWYAAAATQFGDIDEAAEQLDELKKVIDVALETADINIITALASQGQSLGDEINAIRQAVETAANDALVKLYEDVLAEYNTAYSRISSKYEGTGKLEEKQKEFVDNYYQPIVAQKANIDKYKDNLTSCDNYAATVEALNKIKAEIQAMIEKEIDELEQEVINTNNRLYENWVAGLSANGEKEPGSYGDVYKKYVEAAQKLNKYKKIAADDADALAKIKEAEAKLYDIYSALEKNREDVKAKRDAANLDPSERTTTYLSDCIKDYTDKGKEMNNRIDQYIKEAMEAVHEICVKAVKATLVEQTISAAQAYALFDGEYYADVKTNAQAEIAAIVISATKHCTTPEADKANPIADIDITDATLIDATNPALGYEVADGAYSMTHEEVITADNYLDIIAEIQANVQSQLSAINATWTARQAEIYAERKAQTEIEDMIQTVRAYWMLAYGQSNAEQQAQLGTLRQAIDDVEAQYNEALEKNADEENEWDKHAMRDIKDEVLASLTASYNAIYPYADPEAYAATVAAREAAEAAIAALQESIDEAETVLAGLKSQTAKDALGAAIEAAKAQKANAEADMANASSKQGSEADALYANAKATADDAKATLDDAIKAAQPLDGDINGDGTVDANDLQQAIDELNQQAALTIKAYMEEN